MFCWWSFLFDSGTKQSNLQYKSLMHFRSDALWWKVLLFLHSRRITEFDLREQTCRRCSWFHLIGEPTKNKSHSLKTSFKNIRTSRQVLIEEVNAGFFFFCKWWGFEEIHYSTTGEKSCMLTDQFPRLEPTLLPLLDCNQLHIAMDWLFFITVTD